MRRIVVILGVPIDDLTMPEALDRLDELVRIGRATGKSHLVATVNADFVVKSLSDPELRGILQDVDMATADGMPLVWGARLLGVDLAGRVTGADMVPALAERASAKGYRMYLLGAAPGVAARAAEILQAQHPSLQIVGAVSPPYGSVLEMDPAIAEGIRAARPDILLVAFGNPKQEKWMSMHSRSLQVPVMIGVGGTLDLVAGVVRRAPAWMQRSGLEWFYRLAQEPKRLWRRYVIDLAGFGLFFVRQWWAMRGSRGNPTSGRTPPLILPTSEALMIDGVAVVPLRGRLDRGNQDQFFEQAVEPLRSTPYLIVDMRGTGFVDSSGLGVLISLTKRAREAGGELWLAAVPEQVAKVVGLLRLDRFFEIRPDVAIALAEAASAIATRGEAPQAGGAAPAGNAANSATPSQQPIAPGNGAAALAKDRPAGMAAGSPLVEASPKIVIVPMPRRLDAFTAPAMEQETVEALGPGTRLILDFTQTVFLASAGMAAMIKLNRQAQTIGSELCVAGCNADVLRTLKLTRLDRLIALYPDLEAAARSPSAAQDKPRTDTFAGPAATNEPPATR